MRYKKQAPKGGIRTIVGAGTRLYGDIQLAGDGLITGYVKGNVTANRDEEVRLIVSRQGRIEGSVVVPHLVLNGVVEGDVYATGLLELGSTARVMGDLKYNMLRMAVGAELIGRLIHESQEYRVQKDETAAQIGAAPSRRVASR